MVDYSNNNFYRPMAEKLTAEQKRWRADSDADAMARVEEIMQDPSRKKMALDVARQRASDLNKRANIMSRVAGGSTPKSRSGSAKTTSKKK